MTTGARRMLGTVVLGNYEIVDVLGQGGMSVVYKGQHHITGQQVALKLLPPELAAYAGVKERFLEEARALAQLGYSPEQVAANARSFTGQYLAPLLERGRVAAE